MDGTRITGLWKNETKAGEKYLAGNLGLSRLVILPNGFKKDAKEPDFYAYLVPSKKKNGTPAEKKTEGDDLF